MYYACILVTYISGSNLVLDRSDLDCSNLISEFICSNYKHKQFWHFKSATTKNIGPKSKGAPKLVVRGWGPTVHGGTYINSKDYATLSTTK